jgi:membrane associated rhomboid family serine protease
MAILGLDRDPQARAPLVFEPDRPVTPEVLRELRDDLVRRHRRAFLGASPLLLLALLGWLAAATNPRVFGGFGLLSLIVVLIVGQQGYQWWKLRRANPVVLYEREQRDAAQRREDLIAHQERSAEVLPIASIVLTSTIVVVTAVQFLFAPATWLAAGALVKPAVKAGEWWRLLTCTYLHGSLPHISSNAAALFAFARLIETYDRRMRVPLIYLVSAIAGSLLSTVLAAAPSVGASGGVLGLAGYLVAVGRRQGSPLPAWIRQQMLSTIGLTALLGAAAFFLIDNAGHAGGVLAGAALGATLPLGPPSGRRDADDILGAIAAMILGAGALFTIARLLQR